MKNKNFLKKLTAGILGFVMTLGVGAAGYATAASEAKAEDELLSTLTFGGGAKLGSYSGTFNETCGSYTYTIKNFNNNNWGWSSSVSGANKTIKGGSKSGAWTGTIETPKFTYKISKVELYISATRDANVTSVTLYSGGSAGAKTNNLGTFAKNSTGLKSVTISNPSADLFYTIEVVCTKYSSSNGFFAVDYAKFYKQKAAALPLSISGDSTVYNGKNITLSASSNGTTVTGVTWTSSNTNVATVVDGVVTGVGGTTSGANVTITAKKTGYADATKTITVKADTKTLKSISASGATSTFTLGDSFATTGLVVMGTYSHTNGDPDSEEKITSGITTSPTAGTKLNTVGPQTVTVNAGGKSTTYSINVNYAAVESVVLDYTEGTLGKGGEATLPGVTILPANANQGYSWGDAVATEGIVYSYDPSTHELVIGANNAVEGTIQFTATATGDSSKTATVVYTVQAAQIANITGVTASATGEIVAKQYVGDAFNAQGFSFAPTWSEGDHDVVEITADDISWNALVAGSNPTGTYLCADGEFTVTITGVTVVNDTLVSIAFADGCDMTKKSYWVGDSWDFSGLSIVGTMDSGVTAPAISSSNVTFSSDDAVATTTTQISVTATYQGLTTTTPKVVSDIEVKAVTMDSLTINYTGGKPYLGEDIVFAGTIKGNMSNGTQQNVSVSDVDFDVNPYITDQQIVTATHKTTGATGTFNVQYQAKTYTSTTTEQKTLTVRASDVGGKNNSYDLKDWTVDGVSGKSYTYASTSSASAFQFNGSKGTNIFYNTSAIPGKIKSVKMAKSSGTDRAGVEVFVHTSAMTASNYTSGTSLGSQTVTADGVTWSVPTTNTNNNVYLYVHYPTTSALFVDKVEITYEKSTTVTSSEKHAIRIGEVTCSKSPLIAGETISKGDFKIQVQYDTGTALTSNLVPTSVSPTTLVAGTHDYTITYTGSYNDTVTKVIQLTAQEPAVLDSISIVKDSGCDDVFTRNDTFTHNGIHVIAHYTDSTTYPDVDVTPNAHITPPDDMDKAGTKTINVSYEENEVTKTTSYQITVNPIVSTYLNLSGKDIVGSNGIYTLNCGVENKVTLSFSKDGDEEITVSNPTSFLTYDETTGELTVNSQTTESESGTITFTAGSKTAALTVVVTANPLTEFVATGTPDVSEQFRNDSFELNLSGIEIHGVYADETYDVFYEDDFTWDTTGDHPVGTYNENEKLTVTVNSITLANDSIKSISFASGCDMTKKEYWVGDSWDFSGLSITGKMNSKETASIVAADVQYSTNAVVATETTSITVTATYQGLTATKEISGIKVKAVTMDSLTINYTGGQPVLGTDFTFAGSITANMSNGKTQSVNLSDVTIGQVNKFITDQQTITVTHKTTGATGTFNVTYKLAQYWETEPIEHHYSYKLVTEDLSDWSGQYLIVYEDDNNSLAFDGSLTAVDSTPNTFEVGIVNNEIVPTDVINGKCFTIAKSSEGKYSIQNAAGYYIGRNSTGNGIDGSKTYSSSYDNTISYSDGTFTITGNGGKTLSFNNTANQMKFRYLGTTLIKLYKYVDTPTGGGKVPSLEKHPIRIVDANLVDNTSVLIGDSLTKDDFNISVQYDTSTTPVSEDAKKNKITPTSIQKKIGEDTYSNDCTLSAGDNIFKLTYSEEYDGVIYAVEKEITVPAAPKTLEGISLSYGDSFKDQFGLNDTFTHEGVIVTANYANGYKSEDVTNSANVSFSDPDMTTAGEKTVTVTYTEGGVSKTATYTINVTAEKDANLVTLSSEDNGVQTAIINGKSGTVSGYVGNTISLEISLNNFDSSVDVDEKSAVQGLSLDGEISNGVYYGEIEISEEMNNQSYTITVSDGEKDVDIVLSFTAIEDYIESIEASNYQEEYTVGDDFNYEMTVTATYASGNTRVLEDNEYDVDVLELTRGNHNVTVTLKDSEINDKFMITVNKPDDLNIVTYSETPTQGTYELVKDASTLSSGDTILIVAIEDDKYYSLAPYVSGNNCKANEVETPVDDVIGGTCIGLTLGGSSGAWTIYDGTYYLYAAGASSNNHLKGALNANEDTAKWTISIDSEGVATIKCVANIGRNWIRYNAGSDLFACYSGGQSDIYIYKHVPGEPEISYSNNGEISDALFDFVYAWGGDNLDITNWKDIFDSTEYAALNDDDKELLQYAVVSSKDGTKVTTEMFADFITTYDEIVAKNGPSYNELNRTVEYEKYTVQINEQTPTTYQAGDEYTLPTATVAEGNKMVYATESGQVYDAGEKIVIHENLVLSAVEIQDVEKVSVSTEANYKFTTDDNGAFEEVTQTTLRMYISMDADTYNFYVNHGYDFSIVIVNSKNGKSSIINSSSMSIKYDEEKDVYVFNVAFNIPSSQYYSTDLYISLIASNEFASDETIGVTVNYHDAAYDLYQAYIDGDVELNAKQAAALKSILNIVD